MYVQFTSYVISFRKRSISQLSEESDVEERDGTRLPPPQTPGEVLVAVNFSRPHHNYYRSGSTYNNVKIELAKWFSIHEVLNTVRVHSELSREFFSPMTG